MLRDLISRALWTLFVILAVLVATGVTFASIVVCGLIAACVPLALGAVVLWGLFRFLGVA